MVVALLAQLSLFESEVGPAFISDLCELCGPSVEFK